MIPGSVAMTITGEARHNDTKLRVTAKYNTTLTTTKIDSNGRVKIAIWIPAPSTIASRRRPIARNRGIAPNTNHPANADTAPPQKLFIHWLNAPNCSAAKTPPARA